MTSLKGNLNSVDLANIFQMLALNQSEGTLHIFDGASRKAIYFGHDGVSVLTTGNSKHDSLGRVLMRHDRLSTEQLQAALARQDEAGNMMLGQVLVEQGFVTRQEVEEALQIQIEEEIYNLFIWRDAQFEFVEGPPSAEFDDGGIHKIAFNVNSLIMEAAQRVDEWEWIQTIIPSLNGIYRYSGRNVDLDDPIFQESYAGKVLNSIDGTRTVQEIIDISHVNTFEVCKIIALLTEGGAVEAVPVRDLRKSADTSIAAGDTGSALKYLTRIVELEGDTPDMHKQLAEVYEGEQEIGQAAFHYKVYAEVQVDKGNPQEGFRVYHRIVTLLPTDLTAADRMIEIFSLNTDGLEEHAAEIIDHGKLLSECYVELGRTTRAVAVLHRVVSLGSDDTDLRNRLISVYLTSGMTGEAIAEYEALAEAMVSVGDLQEAVKIYRKILTIDASRDDIQQRANQVLSRSRRRQRNLKAAGLTLIFLAIIAAAALYFLKWFETYKSEVQDLRDLAQTEVDTIGASQSTVLSELHGHNQALKAALGEPDELASLYQARAKSRGELRLRAESAINRFADVMERFPEAEGAVTSADNHTQTLRAALRTLDKSEGLAVERLMSSAKEISAQAFQERERGEHIRNVLKRLERALTLGAPCKEWTSSEDGQKARDYATNMREIIEKFDETMQAMKVLVDSGEVAAAFDKGVQFLCEFPPDELAAEVALPVEFRTDPVSARVFLNGADTGVVTPGIVSIPVRVGAQIDLRADGFAPHELTIDAITEVDPKVIRTKAQRTYSAELLKSRAWRSKPLSGTIEATPSLVDGKILVPTRGTAMEVLQPDNGASVRRVTMKSSNGVRARAVAVDGAVAVAAINKVVFFHQPGTWKYQGQTTLPGEIRSDPVVVGGRILISDSAGHLSAVDALSRAVVWRYPERGEIGKDHAFVGPALDVDGEIYAPLRNGVVFVLDPATGRKRRVFTITNKGKPVVLSAAPTVAGEDLFAALRDGSVVRVNHKTGRTRWTMKVADSLEGSPQVAGGTVYVTAHSGKVVALSVADGTITGKHDLTGRIGAGAALAGDTLVVGDTRGTLMAFDVTGGGLVQKWRYRALDTNGRPVEITSRPLFTEKLVVVGVGDRTLHAVER